MVALEIKCKVHDISELETYGVVLFSMVLWLGFKGES